MVDPNGGGDGGGQHMVRFLASSLTALVMSALLIGLYWLVPQHEPKLRPEGPGRAPLRSGVWEKNDFLGLIDTQWTLRDGRAEGDALQFYSNGSLFREMAYRGGRLHGTVREYHEKERYRRPPVRGRVAGPQERAQMAGPIRKISEFREGAADGPYDIFYPNGVLKEEGIYRGGRKRVLARYRKDGRPRGAWSDFFKKKESGTWALGR